MRLRPTSRLFSLLFATLAITACATIQMPIPAQAPNVSLDRARSVALDLPPLVASLPVLPGVATQPSLRSTWMQGVRPTPLMDSPDENGIWFSLLPKDGYFKVIDDDGDWLHIVYGGDRSGVWPGQAWVRAEDVGPAVNPPQWVKNYQKTALGLSTANGQTLELPVWTWLELRGEERDGRLHVRTPGNGRSLPPADGWVAATDVSPVEAPPASRLPRAYPFSTAADTLRITVPYVSQLDGNPWAAANCGPTTLAMALQARGLDVTPGALRKQVLDAQQVWGDDTGVFMESVADVAQQYGALPLGLISPDATIHRWTLDEIRKELRAERPVILQVLFRALPGREDSLYYGDHFIVLTGLTGDGFLYNDPIDSDGVGFDRFMTGDQLDRAMHASDRTYDHAGFSVA